MDYFNDEGPLETNLMYVLENDFKRYLFNDKKANLSI